MVNCIFNDIFIYWSLIYTHVFYDEFADRFFSVKKKKKTFNTTDRRDINTKNDTGLSSKISIK